LEELMLFNFLS